MRMLYVPALNASSMCLPEAWVQDLTSDCIARVSGVLRAEIIGAGTCGDDRHTGATRASLR